MDLKRTPPMDESGQNQLIEECASRAVALLRRNLTPAGIMAASATERAESRRYTRIFGRDAAICVLGMVRTRDPLLLEGAEASLATLAHHQADNGQIPKFADPINEDADFWYLGCIDATLWWLIAVDEYDRHHPGRLLKRQWSGQIERALTWLRCQEHQKLYLLQQNEASDWADIMPRSGFVLYTNALWYRVKVLYDLPHAEETHFHFNHLFFPFSREIPNYQRLKLLTHYIRDKAARSDLYLSFVNFSFWGEEGDVFGNLLAILYGLAEPGPAERMIRSIQESQRDAPYPLRAVCAPISEGHSLWRAYMFRHRQNLPYQYHNGGIWPFIGGFWALVLAQQGLTTEARQTLAQVAQANQLGGWEFNEWLHGKTGKLLGMPGQSWNAATFLLAREALHAAETSPSLPPDAA